MKKMLLLAGLTFGLCTTSFRGDAQVRVNINIGAPVAQQSWYGYDDDYYYMPDQGVYYNTQRRMYVYPEGGRWVSGGLPATAIRRLFLQQCPLLPRSCACAF